MKHGFIYPALVFLLVFSFFIILMIGHTITERCPFDCNRVITTNPYRLQNGQSLTLNRLPVYEVKAQVHEQMLGMYVLLQMLLERQNITYWASAGTFLGLIRHQGFIPWDDDLDLCILSTDLQELVALSDELDRYGYQLRVFKDNVSYIKLVPKKGIAYPFLDLILMEPIEYPSSSWPSDLAPPFTSQKDGPQVYMVPCSVDTKRRYSPARRYPREVHAKSRVFPLKRYPFHHDRTVMPAPHDITLLDDMYPGYQTEARVDHYGQMQRLNNHKSRSYTNYFLCRNGRQLKSI
jgi:hypothetical protein